MKHHKFGRASKAKLETGCTELQLVAERALILSPYDFTLVHVWRGKDVQNALYESNASHTPWPYSKHNVMKDEQPDSEALDFGPWIEGKIPWNDTHIFAVIAGSFFAAGSALGINIRWGGDWNTNGSTKDQTLMDYGHIEVIR